MTFQEGQFGGELWRDLRRGLQRPLPPHRTRWEEAYRLLVSVFAIARQSSTRLDQGQYSPRRWERYSQEGMLQTDGGRHGWLKGRGPCLALIRVVDDASGVCPDRRQAPLATRRKIQ